MRQNRGPGVILYTVTDPSDDPVRPRPGTLRYGASVLPGKVWLTFERDMHIRLVQPLFIKSFTTIAGAGIVIYEVKSIIIHGLHVHGVRAQPAGRVVYPGGAVLKVSEVDGDALRLVGSSKVWIDHNTLSRCEDGLLDVTLGSTAVTVSNNWFSDHDKLMLLGHDDRYAADRRMRVTIAFNHFGPNVNQRMPRIRHGYAHGVNNLYDGWKDYAIGGSMAPSVKSQGNLFVASRRDSAKVTRGISVLHVARNWHSSGDLFENGAFFKQTGKRVQPNYNKKQAFPVASANKVRSLAKDAYALRCSARSAC